MVESKTTEIMVESKMTEKQIELRKIAGKKIDLLSKELVNQNDEFTITIHITEKLDTEGCVGISYKHKEFSELTDEPRWEIERYFVINISETDESFVEVGLLFYKKFKNLCELAYTTL